MIRSEPRRQSEPTCEVKATNVDVTVETGDITKVEADALITAINSGGMWFGGIDRAIQGVAGQMFHDQAAAANLRDGSTVFT